MRTSSGVISLSVILCLFIATQCDGQSTFSAQQPSTDAIGFIENKGQILDQNDELNSDVKFLLLRSGFTCSFVGMDSVMILIAISR